MMQELTLWQAMTPWAVRSLKDKQGWQLQLSAKGDTFALIKPSRHRAQAVAESVWAPRFGLAAVARITLPQELVTQLKVGSVAYEDHRDYVIPADQLGALSLFLTKPISIVDVVTRQHDDRPQFALTG
ncbi:MAG: hypothetical protein VW757_04800 [Halieaceae bacterium]|jgi:hypothetical protein